jgi:BirA family transcriptional regulator, biotin operon repressor / biotin---[acetyl-CoA-carboxylase] ligase
VSAGASGGDIFKPEKQGASWPAGYGRLVLDRVDSTLSEAARRAPDLTGPLWILAEEQTAARGRRGRSWATPRGNFAATLMMRRRDDPSVAALRSFVASLALRRAFIKVTGDEGAFALKWPNDVLLNGGKVAGILLETIGDHLAIGIGVNLAHAPGADQVEPGALRPVSLLGETGVAVPPTAFLDALAAEYALLETQFQTYGFAPIRTAWLADAARLGEEIVARTTRDETRGIFEDVDESGSLILRTAKGRVPVTAADVFF